MNSPRPKRPLCALIALALLGACGTGAEAAGDESTPVPGGTLRIAFWDDQQGCIDPNQVYWIESRSLNRQFAESLTDQDPETGKIVPWLAKSWTINDDATKYTFDLRDDVTFSDGTAFDAEAVKTAFDATHALGARSLLGLTYTAGYRSTTVIDDHTVEVDFDTPNAAFLQASSTTTMAVLSPKTYEQTPEERCTGKSLIGTGPFTLDSYTAATQAHLTRRDDYAWPSELVRNRGAAYLDAIEVSYVKEDSVRVGSLTSGTIDVAWPRLPISEADQKVIEATGATIESRSLPGISSSYFPNVSAGHVLADATVRQALQKAIDRKSYASTIFWDGYPVVTGPYDSTTPYATDAGEALAYDPDGAGTLLDQAGWTLGADGYRVKDGRTLTLTLPVQTTQPGDQLVQDQLKKVGIKLDLKVLTTAQYQSTAADGDYDLLGTYYTRADPSVLGSVLDQKVSKAGTAQLSQSSGTAGEISELFAAGLAATDDGDREQIYGDLQKEIVGQGVMFPLYERVQTAGVAAKVHGFAWTSEAFLRANDIWISR